ncbi:hypothetical protein [Paenarthrobacter sp. DKR-5]|nr:hypothetical protein [Paenarthrobacter sp. DKR-5]
MSADQLPESWLKTASPEEIVKAQKEGRLDDVLAGRSEKKPGGGN